MPNAWVKIELEIIAPLQQPQGQGKSQAELRLDHFLRLVNAAAVQDHSFIDADLDFANVLGTYSFLLNQVVQKFDGGMLAGIHGKSLDRRVQDRIFRAQRLQ